MSASSAAKKARIKSEPEEQGASSGLWIDLERLPTRLAQKGREQQSLAVARLTTEWGANNHYLKLADAASSDDPIGSFEK